MAGMSRDAMIAALQLHGLIPGGATLFGANRHVCFTRIDWTKCAPDVEIPYTNVAYERGEFNVLHLRVPARYWFSIHRLDWDVVPDDYMRAAIEHGALDHGT